MNPDDFEKRLQRQPMRNIPSEWCSEILAAAQQAEQSQHRQRNMQHGSRFTHLFSTLNHQLAALLWPSPKAWAGLAAIWIAILAINHSVGGASQQIADNLTPPSPQAMLALQQQARFSTERPNASEEPAPVVPPPRSDRRDETEAT
jgi:hypothetical protein